MYGLIKMCILGNSNTGKSSIVFRLARDEFNANPESTIGASFFTKIIDNIKYEVWDTAGQERYLALCSMYYRNTDIILLTFDVSDLSTVDRLQYYLDKIDVDKWNRDYRIIVVGNKLDLLDQSTNSLSDIDQYVKKKLNKYSILNDKSEYIYLSAKTSENFEKFKNIIRESGLVLVNQKRGYEKSQAIILQKNTSSSEKDSNFICNGCGK